MSDDKKCVQLFKTLTDYSVTEYAILSNTSRLYASRQLPKLMSNEEGIKQLVSFFDAQTSDKAKKAKLALMREYKIQQSDIQESDIQEIELPEWKQRLVELISLERMSY